MKAIETTYKGYTFRSRLEARWAVFFDAIGLDWEYEKEGYQTAEGYYLPDFWFPGLECFGEVKPKKLTIGEYLKCNSLDRPCILLDAEHPTARSYYATNATEGKYTGREGNGYGEVILSQSAYKGRLWVMLGEDYSDYFVSEIVAEQKAKSARFEFGQSGAI